VEEKDLVGHGRIKFVCDKEESDNDDETLSCE